MYEFTFDFLSLGKNKQENSQVNGLTNTAFTIENSGTDIYEVG